MRRTHAVSLKDACSASPSISSKQTLCIFCCCCFYWKYCWSVGIFQHLVQCAYFLAERSSKLTSCLSITNKPAASAQNKDWEQSDQTADMDQYKGTCKSLPISKAHKIMCISCLNPNWSVITTLCGFTFVTCLTLSWLGAALSLVRNWLLPHWGKNLF